MHKIEFIGFIAGFLVSVALSPQLIKTWKTKSTKDISIFWSITLMTGLLLWVVYAGVNNILPLFIFGLIELSLALTLFVFKLIYK